MAKLSEEELKAKKKYHKKRYKFYSQKLESLDKKDKRIGFKHYD